VFLLECDDGQDMALLKECEVLSTICGYKHRTPNGVSAFPRDGEEIAHPLESTLDPDIHHRLKRCFDIYSVRRIPP
ncbi:MAG TPA: hypothetical protein VIF64_13860, partial [Pyrinomonadaceae bacterium]